MTLRKTKNKKENLDVYIGLRITKSEDMILKRRLKKTTLSKSELIRGVFFNTIDEIPDAESLHFLSMVHLDLTQIGHNLNQIAKAMNGILKEKKELKLTIGQQKIVADINASLANGKEWFEKFNTYAEKKTTKK